MTFLHKSTKFEILKLFFYIGNSLFSNITPLLFKLYTKPFYVMSFSIKLLATYSQCTRTVKRIQNRSIIVSFIIFRTKCFNQFQDECFRLLSWMWCFFFFKALSC